MRPASHLMSSSILENISWQAILLLTPLIILTNISLSGAQSSGDVTILEGGRVWIEGTAGPIDFSCRAEQLSGKGVIKTPQNPQTTLVEDGSISITVVLPVKSLNCGKRAMNRDMYGALKADEYPIIRYRVLEASLNDEMPDSLSGDEGWMKIDTRGVMEIAGVQDTTAVTVLGKVIEGNKFRVKGSKEIHMDTYNIDPPSKMFGLVRASKDLVVHFDVTVALTDTMAYHKH